MQTFMNEDFLLTSEAAKHLYHSFAENLPIIDYHCHISPREIFEDKRFSDITELWLGGDHYKWRLMRSEGIDEYYITGAAPAYEKFLRFASVLPKAIGNPMYHWCHLELKRYFGYDGLLNGDTAPEVWALCNDKLAESSMSARGIIERSGVSFIGTTDDPIDSLEYHRLISEDPSFGTIVAPSFRPDKAFNIDKPGFRDYIGKLSEVCGFKIDSFSALKRALSDRIEHFASHGCRASDHGLDRMVFKEATEEELDAILAVGLNGGILSAADADAFKTALLLHCASEYTRVGFAMQLHYNCLRNPNTRMHARLGPDTGFDCIAPNDGSRKLSMLLDRLFRTDSLPRTIIYSLDASDNACIDAMIGAFQGAGIAGKLQHGSAWWFNDNKQGMRDQLISLANLSILGNFIGMLTDSRSFLSYTRHEYFRRILCDLIGEWVERGEYPNDEAALQGIIRGICCENAKKYFNL